MLWVLIWLACTALYAGQLYPAESWIPFVKKSRAVRVWPRCIQLRNGRPTIRGSPGHRPGDRASTKFYSCKSAPIQSTKTRLELGAIKPDWKFDSWNVILNLRTIFELTRPLVDVGSALLPTWISHPFLFFSQKRAKAPNLDVGLSGEVL